MIETALVLPIALLFLCGIMEYGRFVYTLQVLTNATREGCRYAVTHVNPVSLNGTTYGNATSNVTTVVSNMSPGVTLSGQSTQVFNSDALGNNLGSWTSAQAGTCVCVQVSGNYIPAISKILSFPASVPVTCQAVMRVEGN
jgi:Flp pilus assembly protein TadG